MWRLWALRWLIVLSFCARGVFAAEASLEDLPWARQAPVWLCKLPPLEQTGAVAFPAGVEMSQQGVVVRIQVDFADRSGEPVVQVIYNSGAAAFAETVVAYAKAYRQGCVPAAEARTRYTQEFQFVPGTPQRSIVGGLRVVPLSESGLMDCWKGGERPPLPPLPTLSDSNFKKDNAKPGDLIARLTFTGPKEPPKVQVLFNSAGRRFESAVLDHLAGYRMACLKEGGSPLTVVQTFRFAWGDSLPESVRLTLQQFLGSVDKLADQRVRFDFTTMACPFDVDLTYLQPYTSNHASEAPQHAVNRREFTKWLGRVKLKPSLTVGDRLVGRDINIAVPCLVLDLD